MSAAVFCGCKVEDNSVSRRNRMGMVVTSYWQTATHGVLNLYPNRAFMFNVWLSATEDERPAIEDKYFMNSRLQQISDNEWVVVTNAKTVCRIQTGGKLLSETGAVWTLTTFERQGLHWDLLAFDVDSVVTKITASGNQTWDIRIFGNGIPSDYTPYAHFVVTSVDEGVVPESLTDCHCAISGDGCYAVRTYKYVDNGYNQTEIHNYIRFYLSDAYTDNAYNFSGTLDLKVYEDGDFEDNQEEHYEELNIHDLLSLQAETQYADISIYNVKETWEVIPYDKMYDHYYFDFVLVVW